ncbi:MAG TPA: hypothetical protein VFM55_19205 [Micromonosporaceae bacterium]|nr:hypothetical protein [Micromonosporaceae bacterium]
MTTDAPDTPATETGPDGSPREHWTSIGARDGLRWYRHTWTVDDARAGLLDAFLSADAEDTSGFMGQDMRVKDDNGKTVAVLMHPERARRLSDVTAAVERLKEQPGDGDLHPALHGPRTGGDGLLMDTDVIRRQLAWVLAIKDVGEPPSREKDVIDAWRDRVKARADEIDDEDDIYLLGASVLVAQAVAFWPDERGVVPIRAWNKREDGAEQEAHWRLAYTTPARGLFVRGGGHNLWGEEEYDVVTGSGYAIRRGFMTRDTASGFAAAIAAAVPGIDWRTWDVPLKDMPDSLRDPLIAVTKQWLPWGPKHETNDATEDAATEGATAP